jgi:hypothetical protein
MPSMQIILDGDGAWQDLREKEAQCQFIHLGEEAPPIQVAGLAGGMQSGAPSVAFRIDLPDGTAVMVETSLALFLTAAEAFKARYGDPREGKV